MDKAFGNWLAGFIDGEGCFSISVPDKIRTGKSVPRRPSVRFDISVRMDDAAILREIHKRLGIGKIIVRPARYASMAAGKPQIVWRVGKRAECLQLAELLEAHPLRAKKKRDFAIWRIALDDLLAHPLPYGKKRGSRADDDAYVERMDSYRLALKEIRQYEGEEPELPQRETERQLRLVARG